MKFVSLRKEVDKVLSLANYDNVKVKMYNVEPIVYLYKHAAIIANPIHSISIPDLAELAQYIVDHPHISKVLVPYIGPRNINQFAFKLSQSKFFDIIDRDIRMIIDEPDNIDISSLSEDFIRNHNIRYYNYHKRAPSYYIKPHEIITVYCSFLEYNRNSLLSRQVIQYTVKRKAVASLKN